TGGGSAAVAARAVRARLDRRQRPLLPGPAAYPLSRFGSRPGAPSIPGEGVMKAIQVVGYHEKLQLTEVPAPEPAGPFDVVVKIGGAGVCRTDIHILEGQWAEKSGVTLPYTIGHENAGWVHAVGGAVTNVAEGDKVIVHPLVT